MSVYSVHFYCVLYSYICISMLHEYTCVVISAKGRIIYIIHFISGDSFDKYKLIHILNKFIVCQVLKVKMQLTFQIFVLFLQSSNKIIPSYFSIIV